MVGILVLLILIFLGYKHDKKVKSRKITSANKRWRLSLQSGTNNNNCNRDDDNCDKETKGARETVQNDRNGEGIKVSSHEKAASSIVSLQIEGLKPASIPRDDNIKHNMHDNANESSDGSIEDMFGNVNTQENKMDEKNSVTSTRTSGIASKTLVGDKSPTMQPLPTTSAQDC